MKQQFQARARIIAGIFAVGLIAIVFRIVYIQTNEASKTLAAWGMDNTWNVVTIYPERGKIYDRNGHMLAGNKTVYEIGVTLASVKDPHTVALSLNAILGMDYQKTFDAITAKYDGLIYLVLDKYVPADKAQKLKDLKAELAAKYTGSGDPTLVGLEFRATMMRSYPDKSLASNVIGFVSMNNSGNYGVEQKYDSLLAGVPKTVYVPLDPNLAGETPKVPAGTDLILTIDREIQAMVETELNKSLVDTGSAAGTIVVMDPKTGEILALASTPQMDLNDYGNYGNLYKQAAEFDRAISMQYEPGSVFKILTMAAAIDSGLVTPQTTYLDTGFYTIGGVNIFNWDYSAWGPQDMVGCFQHSLNVCMARLADLMGEKTFYTYMRRFGIGHPTGIDLSNETSGRLKDPADADWYKVDLGTNAFGQGVAVSPIQLMTAASALANDGKMVYPHVLYAMINNGNQHNTPVQTLGTPVSPQTARTITGMLADALQAGKAVANVEGYRIAGKTGTASIPGDNGLYDPNQTNASFIGWGPVDDPKFMVYVWMERPQSSDWASYVASPIFHNVVEKLVVLMNIPPDDVRKQLAGQ
ncbi:MAG TPA: penicillin-binding protein 2 [Anaerolineales bacterium]|jgi:cell division protein FtsI/penicillin-binding protein 2